MNGAVCHSEAANSIDPSADPIPTRNTAKPVAITPGEFADSDPEGLCFETSLTSIFNP